MTSTQPLRSLPERYAEARRAAEEGYGWADLVVKFGLAEATARQIVTEAEFARLANVKDSKP